MRKLVLAAVAGTGLLVGTAGSALARPSEPFFPELVRAAVRSGTVDARPAVAALDQALATRHPAPGLIHHSDRSAQYASGDYVVRLAGIGAWTSPAATGNPYENATAESFFKTPKWEEVYLQEYRTLEEAEANIGRFIDDVYNTKRLRSSLSYLPPAEFEAARLAAAPGGGSA